MLRIAQFFFEIFIEVLFFFYATVSLSKNLIFMRLRMIDCPASAMFGLNLNFSFAKISEQNKRNAILFDFSSP